MHQGGGRVVRWSWSSSGASYNLADRAGAYCACNRCGRGLFGHFCSPLSCLDIFTLLCPFSPLSPYLWETARYRLKYCLKGPLNPKQPTNLSMHQRSVWKQGFDVEILSDCCIIFQAPKTWLPTRVVEFFVHQRPGLQPGFWCQAKVRKLYSFSYIKARCTLCQKTLRRKRPVHL